MMFLENWVAVLGFVTAVVMLYRMNLSLGDEFSSDADIVKNPFGYAVRTSVEFGEFEANNWRAFDALVTAERFRKFHRRFRVLIDPHDSKLCSLFVLGGMVLLLVVAQISGAGPQTNNRIGGGGALAIAVWWAIVDYGKALKNSVAKLRIG